MKKFLKTLGKSLLYILVYVLLQVFVGGMVGVFLGVMYFNRPEMIMDVLMKYMFVILILSGGISLFIYESLLRSKGKKLLKTCNFKKIPGKDYLINGILAIALTFVTSGFILYVGKYFPSYNEVANTIGGSMDTIFGIITLVILVPIFEEILFRGLVFTELKSNMNIAAAVILQAFLFGLIHGNILQGIYAFTLGVITALVVVWSKSIMSSITVHVFFNISGTLFAPMVIHYTSQYTALYMIVGTVITAICLLLLYKLRVKSEESNVLIAENSEFENI